MSPYFALIAIVIVILIAVSWWMVHNINRKFKPIDPFKKPLDLSSILYNQARVDCNQQVHYCFEDSECSLACDYSTTYKCMHGICRNEVVRTEDVLNECDPKMGILAYMTGDTQFGRYQFVCKSEDPGIAVNTTTNLMCAGGDIDINYTQVFPGIDSCQCPDDSTILVPATSVKRRHVQCDSRYVDLVDYSNVLL